MKGEMFLTCTRNSLGRDGRLRKDFVKQTQSIAKQPALSLIWLYKSQRAFKIGNVARDRPTNGSAKRESNDATGSGNRRRH